MVFGWYGVWGFGGLLGGGDGGGFSLGRRWWLYGMRV